jgi:diguanylate cyclase (GGDEF)-like protein
MLPDEDGATGVTEKRIGIMVDRAAERRGVFPADVSSQVHGDGAFDELLKVEVSRSARHLRPLSLLMLGLDGVEADRTVSGKSGRNALMEKVASLTKKSVRQCDVVARYGRDKLAIILVETSKLDAIATADRIRRILEDTDLGQRDVFPHANCSVNAGIGVASYPVDACEQGRLVVKAEEALSAAKAVGGNPVIPAEQELFLMANYRERSLYFLCKRCLDIILSLLLLVVAAPLLLLIALLVKVDSPGPAFFRQPRVGLRKQVFEGETVWQLAVYSMYKFRTMYHRRDRGMHWRFMKALIGQDEDEIVLLRTNSGSAVNKLSGDPRVTRVGKVLRRTNLDELPQVFNVLRGDMSLVGPRPPILYEVAEYAPHHWRRLQTVPGCTGLWQVSGWCTTGFEEQVKIDIDYIEHQSLWLDMKILLKTLPAMLSAKGGR